MFNIKSVKIKSRDAFGIKSKQTHKINKKSLFLAQSPFVQDKCVFFVYDSNI